MEATLVRRWSMAERCLWPGGCSQDQADDSGEFCYYHFKLVEGQIDPRTHTPKPQLDQALEDLSRSGAVPGAIARAHSKEPEIPYDRKANKKGRLRRGVLRFPR